MSNRARSLGCSATRGGCCLRTTHISACAPVFVERGFLTNRRALGGIAGSEVRRRSVGRESITFLKASLGIALGLSLPELALG
jgi:hypothetical protein